MDVLYVLNKVLQWTEETIAEGETIQFLMREAKLSVQELHEELGYTIEEIAEAIFEGIDEDQRKFYMEKDDMEYLIKAGVSW